MAKRLQYVTGAERDALDRQLSLIGEWDYPYGRRGFGACPALSERGLAELDDESRDTHPRPADDSGH